MEVENCLLQHLGTDQALLMQDEYFAECRLADQMGFDWVSIAEHYYSPGSLAPSINVLGAALAQQVKRAKIAILGGDKSPGKLLDPRKSGLAK